MPHIYPFGIITEDTLIKTGAGKLFSFSVIFKGATKGDFVTFIDGIDITGKDRCVIVCPGTTDVNRNEPVKIWPSGKSFEVGLFVNIHGSTGTIFVSGDYR